MNIITQKKRINKEQLVRILLEKGSSLCDDMISVILEYIGYNNGMLDLRKALLILYAYENYRLERLQLYNMYCEKSLQICNILYKKVSNYNVVQIDRIIDKYITGQQPLLNNDKIRDIVCVGDRILDMHHKLRQKTMFRCDYEYYMDNSHNIRFRKAIINFLKFDYISLKTDRKIFLPIFDEIRTLTLL